MSDAVISCIATPNYTRGVKQKQKTSPHQGEPRWSNNNLCRYHFSSPVMTTDISYCTVYLTIWILWVGFECSNHFGCSNIHECMHHGMLSQANAIITMHIRPMANRNSSLTLIEKSAFTRMSNIVWCKHCGAYRTTMLYRSCTLPFFHWLSCVPWLYLKNIWLFIGVR